MNRGWDAIASLVGDATGQPFPLREHVPVSGGSINSAYRIGDGSRSYFLKINRADGLDMFRAEAAGLEALAAARALRVPQVVACGHAGERACLVLEWITLHGRGDWAALGRGLAAQHRSQGERHGWHRDNTIGATPQPNPPTEEWPVFFARYRLGHQLDLLERQGGHGALVDAGRRLQQRIPALLDDAQPVPSLLHGDLWSGNVAFDENGVPVVYDPAVHFGDRECDLAMTELFGRFPQAFYDAYQQAWPVDGGYARRKNLYQLYHVLNHVNLFGGTYAGQAHGLLGVLLAEANG
ncbi:MAG: fructosamine kinase family protein [Ectothiorhodospiraceae bacterium]|nr:fructosamine kinase family protein [Ectothiorhodospiraceae bacterium]